MRLRRSVVLLSCLVFVGTGVAHAQRSPVAGPAPGPCSFSDIDVDRYGRQPFRNPPAIRSRNGALRTTLEVRYSDPATTSIGGCDVKLRTYNGALVGPTLRVKPGDVVNLLLDNQLPRETRKEIEAQYQQEAGNAFIETRPHSFNTTNLHTHGMHVSPKGNSDNVLLAIAPQTRQQYRIKVPEDHTRGSYWYHAHAHGSTAVQVGSGMAGALIVEDDSTKIPASLRAANRGEKVLVIGTVLYDANGRVEDISAFFPDSDQTAQQCAQGLPSCTWQNSKRRTTINGQIVPVIRMRPGEVQRWRLIDAAFRESMNIQLEQHALHEIAVDGIYLGRVDTWSPAQSVELQPGYRSDVLVQASMTPGTYRLLDAASPAATSLRGVAEDENVLAEVVVEGEPVDMALPTNEEMAPLAPFPGLDLKAEADGVQEVVFKLGSSVSSADQRNYFQVNYAAFNPTQKRFLQLNATDMWRLTTVGDPFANGIPPVLHVFHIHVNPFQMTRADPDGQNETVWKDTVVVPAGGTVELYTRYTDFTGKFVIHCHILDHEDLGMMQVVEVVDKLPPPSLRGEPNEPHH